MCADSWEGTEVHNWCGNGWTGQPAVFERDGRTWVVFDAYDRAIHVVDGVTGEDILPPFFTGDIIKGSVTIDPDGYPLIYTGSRDNKFRVLAFDRPQLTELWSLDANAVSPTLWNDDWDSSALVLHDWLFEGGENSQIHAVKLNRAIGADNLVTVAPDLRWHTPGWDAELLHDFGSTDVSIETSVAVYGNTLYFTNSGGLVQGWDIAPLLDGSGEPQRVFRYWAGDDTDGTITVDEQGMLYLGVEWERHLPRASEVGQMLKLDPSHPDNPLVWSLHDDRIAQAGVYSSAGLVGDLVIYTTYSGRARRHRPRHRRRAVGEAASRPADGVAGDRRRHVAAGGLLRGAARVRRARHRSSSRRRCGRSRWAAASRRRRRCGTVASTSARARASSTRSPTRDKMSAC